MSTQLVPVDEGAQLDVRDWGSGEPLVFVQTALTADELVPLARTSALERGYRKVVYHRRGYAGSSAVHGPGSIVRDAADCHALLDALGIGRAHIVGFSYSAAVALQLAAEAPRSVHTLVLMEPPPVHTASAAEFRAANERLLETRRRRGLMVALDEFLSALVGPDWRVVMERHLPGSAGQMPRMRPRSSTWTCLRCFVGGSGQATPGASPVRSCMWVALTAARGSRRSAT